MGMLWLGIKCNKLFILQTATKLKLGKESVISGLDEWLELVPRRGYKIARLLHYHHVVITCVTFTTYIRCALT